MSVSDFIQQNILFLKGVSLDDIISIEDEYQKELLNELITAESTPIENTAWDKLPKTFNPLQLNENISTNLRCWFCTLKFKSRPLFIITNTNHTHNGIIYDILGNFCSFGCVQAYIDIYYNKRTHFDIYQSPFKLYQILYNKKINKFIPSPSKYNLKMYGGKLSLDEYRHNIKKINEQNIKAGY